MTLTHDSGHRFSNKIFWILIAGKICACPGDELGSSWQSGLRVGEQELAFQRVEARILAGFALDHEAPAPGGKLVSPGFDRVDMPAELGGREARRPAVIAEEAHGHALPGALAFAAPDELGSQHIMAVTQNVGPDIDRLADDAFDGETPTVDPGIDVLDVEAAFDGGFRRLGG